MNAPAKLMFLILVFPDFIERSSRLRKALEFEAVTVYFQPPSADEAFNVVRHART